MRHGNAVTSSTLSADPPPNETIDVFYIKNTDRHTHVCQSQQLANHTAVLFLLATVNEVPLCPSGDCVPSSFHMYILKIQQTDFHIPFISTVPQTNRPFIHSLICIVDQYLGGSSPLCALTSILISGYVRQTLRWSRGSVLAFSTQVRGFKPGRSRRIFSSEKILSTPSFGGEVKPSVPCRRFAACKRSLNVAWKSTFRQN